MKKIYLGVLAIIGCVGTTFAQNPGLLVSEFLQNPGGIDSPYEYVELLATDDIDFAVTPYSVIVSNNGTASADGWVAGGSLTYAFEISTGTVSVGDVVYVGGSMMAPTGTVLRSINTATDNGDGGIGNSNAGGVFGNGGGNGDGIAVFNLPIASITSTTVPTDAVIYGSGVGGAAVSPTEGYQLPVNDHYAGGKLAADSYVAPDENLTIATGVYDLSTFTFLESRVFTEDAGSDGISAITFAEIVTPKFSFVSEDVTVLEEAGVISLNVELTESNGTASSMDVVVIGSSSATNVEDYVLLDTTITSDGTADEVISFTIQIEEDALEEQSEFIILSIDNLDNAEIGELANMYVYITDNDRVLAAATNELNFELLTSFSTGTEEISSAEIIAFDETTDRLFIANSLANQIDIVDFSNPATPVLLDSIDLDSVGFINSIAVYDGVMAAAIQAPVAQDSGFVSFFNTADGAFLNRLTVGALPDMVTFNNAGTQVVIACEGEPNDDYTVDPNGGVSIIDIDGDFESLTAANVENLDFTAFEVDIDDLKSEGVRIFGLDATLAQDLEPEYVTVLDGDEIAFVVLQENNAIAEVDLIAKEILDIYPLGTIDHSVYGYGIDASNKTSGINIANLPIQGMFMPDAIAHLEIGGESYLFTANEGDSRDYDGYSEEERVDDLELDATAFPDADYLQSDYLLGRLKTTSATGDTDGDGDIDVIHSYGTRSFSIWDTEGDLVFDSGDFIEQIIANHPVYVDLFNRGNDFDSDEAKNRSDDKGPEPEGVVATMIEGNAYLFVSLERVGGAMAFNINDPANPVYIGYHNNRDVETNGPDRGAEGMIFIDAESSPNENGLLILANEVSSTLSIYQINSCLEVSGLEITTAADELTFCEEDSLEIIATENEDVNYQWHFAGSEIDGAVAHNYFASEGGFYQVSFINTVEGCEGIADSVFVTELPIPTPTISVTDAVLSTGVFASYQWYFEGEEIAGATNMEYTPTEDGEYIVLVTGENGCSGEATIEVSFTGIESNEQFNTVLYPNPANDIVTITISGQGNETASVEIIDITGAVVYRDQISGAKKVDISNLSTGVYFVRSSFGKINQSQKLIVR